MRAMRYYHCCVVLNPPFVVVVCRFHCGWRRVRAICQVEVVDELKYLIKWSGLSYQFCTWETREEVRIFIRYATAALPRRVTFVC